ncbi:MAG: DUF3419 family protein [Alphaproteobacteria bacterium]|nr:DUF3419 family protein [Alphaproteobacteria bacterium]
MPPADSAPAPAAHGAEVAERTAFAEILYAQCWEDAEVLLAGLDPQPGESCLSICSGGDNALALLTRDPARVLAIDLAPPQLACLGLRMAAFRALDHQGLLELVGSRPSARRAALYAHCRPAIADPAHRDFWDRNRDALVQDGLGELGRFERYFRLFRRWVLPLVHGRATVDALLEVREPAAREAFFRDRWNGWRWRLLIRTFFSRFVMARLGRNPAFFDYAEGSLSDQVMHRARHAVTALDPAANPYLHWILRGGHGTALPVYLRPENFAIIRDRLDRIEPRLCSIEEVAAGSAAAGERFHRFNLSDVFEYMSAAHAEAALAGLAAIGRPGGRLLYWNMLVPRARPAALAYRLRPLDAVARNLHAADKAFFYSRLVVEEIL